jgi:hypothetical protein
MDKEEKNILNARSRVSMGANDSNRSWDEPFFLGGMERNQLVIVCNVPYSSAISTTVENGTTG